MKNLKKAAAVLTVAAMSAAMGMSAFADSPIEAIGGSDSKAVMGTYNDGSSDETTYKVDISWDAMRFIYETQGVRTWDAENHVYIEPTSGGKWTSEASSITITNHSNAELRAKLEFDAETAFDGKVSATFNGADENDMLTLLDASSEAYYAKTDAPTASAKLELEGNPGEFSGEQTIGTVIVTIQKPE